MKVSFNRLRRSVYVAIAFALAVAGLVPVLSGTAHADQIQDRYVKMSTSANGASATYEVGFQLAQAHDLRGIIIDFCEETPIINDTTCTLPGSSGFSVGTPTATVSGSFTAAGSWTFASMNSGRTFRATNATANSVSASTSGTVTITTMTNPDTTNTSFYARIYTYETTAGATGYTVANPAAGGTVRDSGGVAMSTAAQVTVTAKVQEQLSFCVYTGANCAAGGTAVALGDANGVLSDAAEFIDKATRFDLSSNAADNVTVRLKANNTLTSGSNNIDAIGATPATSTNGSEQFGLCAYRSTGSLLTIDTVYDGGAGAQCSGTVDNSGGTPNAGDDNGAEFALDTNATDGTASTYGDTLATMAAGTSNTGTIAFIGNISATTPAGIYTSILTFIATGQY